MPRWRSPGSCQDAVPRAGGLYVTHFGRLADLGRVAADLHRLIDAHAALGERRRRAGAGRKRLLKEGVIESWLDSEGN